MENNKEGHPEGCRCWPCQKEGGICGGWGCSSGLTCWHRHIVLRWLLAVAVLIFVFCLGVKFGEFKAELYSDYGYGHMWGGYGRTMRGGMMPYGTWGYPGTPMMGGRWNIAAPVPPATSSTSK